MPPPLESVLSPVCALAAAGVLALSGGAGSSPSTAVAVAREPAADPPVYVLPVPGPARVVAPFDPPATPYAAGHRGTDLAVGRRSQVRSAAAGVVRFAGAVAGRGVVVVAHADGILTEYEPVRPAVRPGAHVRSGEVIGTVLGRHRDCAPDRCLHWSARRAGRYLDPMSLLDGLGPVRLLPWSRDPP